MIEIYKSNRLTKLAEKFSEFIEKKADSDPLHPQTVVVPNLDTARWLKLYLAEKNGITANIDYLLVSEWQYSLIRNIYPDLPRLLPSDILPMSWSVYKILSNSDELNQFPGLQRYIKRQNEEYAGLAAWSLSKQISYVFDQYIVYRPELLADWQADKFGKTNDEKWQKELWLLLNQYWQTLSPSILRKNRSDLFFELQKVLEKQKPGVNESVFVFNPGLIPPPILRSMVLFSESADLFLFYLQLTKDQVLTAEQQHSLIEGFGQEALNINQSVSEISGQQGKWIEAYHKHPESTLHRIQNSIVFGVEIKDTVQQDQSIQIRSCHSALREVEVLHQFLLECFEKDHDLHPDDVLVVTPEPKPYVPFFKAVFNSHENGIPDIPWHIGGVDSGSKPVKRAFEQILNMFDSRFTFSDVMDLFLMPVVHESFGISGGDANRVKEWMLENHVVWGLSDKHRTEFEQPPEDHQTWHAALKRGWLGQLISSEPGTMAQDVLLYSKIDTESDRNSWASFSLFLNQLGEYRSQSRQGRPVSEWCDWFTKILDQFIYDSPEIRSSKENIIHSIEKLRQSTRLIEFDGLISFSQIRQEVISQLEQQPGGSAFFTRGVTFSSMVPVRSIPFKIIALIGLNRDSFPRKPKSPDFDLMAKAPVRGERNRKHEDRNLFLESITSAGKIHYCSFTGQDPVDNDTIPPSPIISEWTDYLASIFDCKPDNIIQKEPLSSFSPGNFSGIKSYSFINFKTAKKLTGKSAQIQGIQYSKEILLPESPAGISIREMVRFYKSPMQWFLNKRFGAILREPDEEKSEFQIDHLENHLLFQRLFGWMLEGMPVKKMKAYLLESGVLPSGWPGEKRMLQMIESIQTVEKSMIGNGFKPAFTNLDVSFTSNQERFDGVITSFSDNAFLDVNPSSYSGSTAIQTWVKHLCLQAGGVFSGSPSYLLCDIKKGDITWKKFTPVPDYEEILNQLINFFKEGRKSPVPFFPKSLFVFEEQDIKGNDAYKKAAKEFEGDDFKIGENRNIYISALTGEDASFRDEFLQDEYCSIIRVMRDHMEDEL